MGSGSRTIDCTKVGLALQAVPSLEDAVTKPARSGLVHIDNCAHRSDPTFVAVPTTYGPGSEVTTVAILTHGARRRLLAGQLLSPSVAYLDPEATETLPIWLMVEGAAEILLRLAVGYIATTDEISLEDDLLETLAGRAAHHCRKACELQVKR